MSVYYDFVNLKIYLSFNYKGSERVCIYMCECTYVRVCICTVFLDVKSVGNLGKIWMVNVIEPAGAMPFGK